MKRRLLKLGLLILAGAIVNVAVAECCAIWSPMQIHQPGYAWNAPTKEFGIDLLVPPHWWLDIDKLSLDGVSYDEFSGFGVHSKQIVVQHGPQYVDGRIAWRLLHVHRAGWPLRCLQCQGSLEWDDRRFRRAVRKEMAWDSGVKAPSLFKHVKTNRYRITEYRHPFPLGVVCPGFAINTIFYAAILWLLFAAPSFIRRRIRIKRGLCPACAYPVGESETCTECGKPIPCPSRGRAREAVERTP
ncbi:MAG: hypothetical protein L0Y44_11750 [Phycisphaerales bacterium]|nr:hypothetical protein [Phycisphaerales bacterium]